MMVTTVDTMGGSLLLTVQYPLTLQCANISILDHNLCRWAYPGHISDSMLCAGLWEGGRGSCQVRATLGRSRMDILPDSWVLGN